MIEIRDNLYVLNTNNTTYAFRVMETGHLEHLYYGSKINIADPESLVEKHKFQPGNSIAYDSEHAEFTLEDMCLEMSGYGKGDIREPFVEVVAADGSTTTDFVFESAEKLAGKEALETLPSSYDNANEVETLRIELKDKNNGYTLRLNYYVFADTDVISRDAKFINTSDEEVKLRRLMSTQLDLNKAGLVVSSFHGGWVKEMQKYDTTVNIGKFVNSSYTGSSSNRSNPFIMVSDANTSAEYGDCYGFNLVYSGNHYEAVEVNAYDKTRIVTGINPQGFEFTIAPGESFEAPEAIMTYSHDGHDGMSRHMHDFVKEHIVRGEWKDKERPLLLNSWEASYFNISESSLVKLAKMGKDVGVELFVMDDGWFGERHDDKRALGDWTPNKKKLPGGVDGLCRKINKLGLDFGIWIEPEMVNVDSDLYRAHPEWSIEIPGKHHSEGRNQRILDFANPEVVDYITESMVKVLESANIAYVKWDMNRIFSDYYSQYLPKDRQGELSHRYIMGVYKLAKNLTEKFPHILFEGCASGGNRFDLGALCYFPQIWGSDNTDAISRLSIQNGYSYGYPLNTVTAHVSSCPNHQTLRSTPLATRFAVASFGVLGYETNLCDLSKDELKEIKAQIELYKKYRKTWQFGDFYRVEYGNHVMWNVVSKDKKQAIGMLVQKEVMPNEMYACFRAKGLDPNIKYHFTNIKTEYNVKLFGDLINTAAPFHVKPGSLMQNLIAKFVKMPGEVEDYVCYGSAIMNEGVRLHQSFVGTGYDGDVRFFPDYSGRLYFMEAVED